MSIKPDQLGAAIAESLQAYAEATQDQLLAAIQTTADEAAEVVRSKARSLYGSNYANDISARPATKTVKQGAAIVKTYVTAGDHYRVAHLLEHGHAIVSGGRVLGRVEGKEHFADGERYAEEHIVENIRKEMD